MKNSITLRTFYICVPIALLLLGSNWCLWRLAGYPAGYTPRLSELSPFVRSLYTLANSFVILQYSVYGAIYAWLHHAYRENLSYRDAALGGIMTGFMMGIISTIIRIPGVVLLNVISLELILGMLVGAILSAITGALLGAPGSLITTFLLARWTITS
jgi:hypothetical protein